MKRVDVASRLPELLGLSRQEAAAFIGISATTFDELVAEGLMPQPRRIRSRAIWDADELRAAFKALPHDNDDSDKEPDTWAEFRARHLPSNG